jgi:SAM-dependent methyltransferase
MENVGDPSGYLTLKIFSGANNFNRWLFDRVSPFCKGSVLEIGSGIGNISQLLVSSNSPVTLSDIRPEYCTFLKSKFKDNSNVKEVLQINLASLEFESDYKELKGSFDTIVALNVIEHIQVNSQAIRNCRKLLRENGRLVILVPAFQSLYNSLDIELGHFTRYSRVRLSGLLIDNGFKVQRINYFNSMALVGWWVFGSLLKRKLVANSLIRFYDSLVPCFRVLDRPMNNLAGLSLIAIAELQS